MAQSFTTTNNVGALALPQEKTFTLDAAVAYEVEAINIPNDARWISIYFSGADGRVSFDQSLTDGSSTLSATTGIPHEADRWIDYPVDQGKGANRIAKVFVASATVSTRVYAVALGG